METVGYTSFCCQTNHGVHHITATSHYKTNVTGAIQYHSSGFHKVFRTFLHGDTSQESNNLFFRILLNLNILYFFWKRRYRIVHGEYFARILIILVNNRLTCQLTYTHDAISMVHTVLFNGVNSRIHITTASVKVCSVYMDNQRFSRNLLSMNTSRISQPVVRVNNIKLLLTSHHTGYNRIVIDFFMQIIRISSRKLHATQIIGMHIIKICINMVTQVIIKLRIHIMSHSIFYIIPLYVTPYNRYTVHSYDT